jgi:hypothetical protein
MNSQITDDFLACFARLPEAVKAQARKAYRLWRENPAHPSLHFNALGLLEGDTITWFWIGSHAEYDQLIS